MLNVVALSASHPIHQARPLRSFSSGVPPLLYVSNAKRKIHAEKYEHKNCVTFCYTFAKKQTKRNFFQQFQNHTLTQGITRGTRQREHERVGVSCYCDKKKKPAEKIAPKSIRINSIDNREEEEKIVCSNPSKTKYESNDNIIPYINGHVKIHIICRWNETYNKLIEYYVERFV